MKTNKEIVTEIIEDLEKTVGLNWPKSKRAKITRDKLIECWSQNEIVDWKFYGYAFSSGVSKPYNKIFSNVIKKSKQIWKLQILHKYSYKYCHKCHGLYSLNNFSSDVSRFDDKQVYCVSCTNKQSNLHYINNKSCYYAKGAKRRASKINRTPSWLTENDYKEMEKYYIKANEIEVETGVKQHVDHIIPLQGENISGLHMPSNLQILPATENLSKGNKYFIT